ncbi:hypothetical protein GEMRC1_003888 [Eukaryota sp. GEM-RC1]
MYSGAEEEGKSLIEWFVSKDKSSWKSVGQGPEFLPLPDHVGCYVLCKYLPISVGNVEGEVAEIVSQDPITWGKPILSDCVVYLDDSCGKLRANYRYHGPDGSTSISWFRIFSGKKEIKVAEGDVYELSQDDVGSRVRAVLIPVSNCNVSGDPVELETSRLTKAVIGGSSIPEDLIKSKISSKNSDFISRFSW